MILESQEFIVSLESPNLLEQVARSTGHAEHVRPPHGQLAVSWARADAWKAGLVHGGRQAWPRQCAEKGRRLGRESIL